MPPFRGRQPGASAADPRAGGPRRCPGRSALRGARDRAVVDVPFSARRPPPHLLGRRSDRLEGVRGPPRDWADVEGILVRQAGRLDWGQVRQELAPLLELKEAPELLERLERLRRQLGA